LHERCLLSASFIIIFSWGRGGLEVNMIARAVIVALISAASVVSVVRAEESKLADKAFVGNWFVFFNPSKGTTGTQQLSVDVDETGSYIATDMQGELKPVKARLEAKDGKFTLRDLTGKVLDEGTYEPMGPQLQLTGSAGKGFWTKVAAESKQASIKAPDVDLKAAPFAPILAGAIKSAREKWQKDAVLVEAKIIPNDDGTIDLTAPGGNGYLKFLSPSSGKGCLGMLGNFGEVNLYPDERGASAFHLAVPSNVIELPKALSIAKNEGARGIKEAALYGCGDDPDLRQFCWVFTTQDSVVAVDALLGNTTNYREFMDGRPRAIRVPFMPNTGVVSFQHSFDGTGPPEMMWYARRPVFLDGMDEAIIVIVPWRVVPEAELLQHAIRSPSGGIQYRGDAELYPRGDTVPLEGDVLKAFMRNEDSIQLACAPFAVRTEGPLAKYPPDTKQRITNQLESFWRSNKGGAVR